MTMHERQGEEPLELRFAGKLEQGQQLAINCSDCKASILLGDIHANDGVRAIKCRCGKEYIIEFRISATR